MELTCQHTGGVAVDREQVVVQLQPFLLLGSGLLIANRRPHDDRLVEGEKSLAHGYRQGADIGCHLKGRKMRKN